MSEDSAALLRVAERDAAALRGMLDAMTIPDEIFGFVAQRAIEKALKAMDRRFGS